VDTCFWSPTLTFSKLRVYFQKILTVYTNTTNRSGFYELMVRYVIAATLRRYGHLRELDLSDNLIVSLSEASFSWCEKLETLRVAGNNLTSIRTNTFAGERSNKIGFLQIKCPWHFKSYGRQKLFVKFVKTVMLLKMILYHSLTHLAVWCYVERSQRIGGA